MEDANEQEYKKYLEDIKRKYDKAFAELDKDREKRKQFKNKKK